MGSIRITGRKKQDAIVHEWDRIAAARDFQVAAGQDFSYSLVLEPWILGRIHGAKTIVDVGCGTGRLTSALSDRAESVFGVDLSPASIEIAKGHDQRSTYTSMSIEDWVASTHYVRADLVVTNMVLMDALDLDRVCDAISRIVPQGRVLATITHPAFWPLYWGYASEPDFDYSKQLVVEAPFKTKSHDFGVTTTHVHRPISSYLSSFHRSGLDITNLDEIRGPEKSSDFPFPRFIGIEASTRR